MNLADFLCSPGNEAVNNVHLHDFCLSVDLPVDFIATAEDVRTRRLVHQCRRAAMGSHPSEGGVTPTEHSEKTLELAYLTLVLLSLVGWNHPRFWPTSLGAQDALIY